MRLQCAGATLELARPAIMGVLNTTPDSFHAESRVHGPDDALERARAMAAAGAAIVDVGGESTRPGSPPVDEATERARVLPVIEALAAELDVVVSVDTRRSAVAEAAIQRGAGIVNDVTAARHDPRMLETCRNTGAALVLMHMQGTPATMQKDPRYGDPVAEIRAFLVERAEAALKAGLEREQVVLDPGIGFGKRLEHNVALLRGVRTFVETGHPVLVGHSRKSFLSQLTDRAVDQRLASTVAVTSWLAHEGVHIVRVHDVAENLDAIRVGLALRGAA